MTPTLDRDVAEAIYKLLGDTYETEYVWCKWHKAESAYRTEWHIDSYWTINNEYKEDKIELSWHPAPSFQETIRLLPKIGEKKGWYGRTGEDALMIWNIVSDCAHRYVAAPTAEEGMKLVSDYLRKILV